MPRLGGGRAVSSQLKRQIKHGHGKLQMKPDLVRYDRLEAKSKEAKPTCPPGLIPHLGLRQSPPYTPHPSPVILNFPAVSSLR